jgi:hypothetical protein
MTYQLTRFGTIIRLSDGFTIPFDLRNIDYQEYLKWVAEGNTPLPAPEDIPTPNFRGFLDAVIASPLYQKVGEQSVTTPAVNVAFTTTMGALILASTGQPNLTALQSGFSNLLAAMTVDQNDLDSLQALLVGTGLDTLITISVTPS